MPQIHWGRDSLQRQGFRIGPVEINRELAQIPKLTLNFEGVLYVENTGVKCPKKNIQKH